MSLFNFKKKEEIETPPQANVGIKPMATFAPPSSEDAALSALALKSIKEGVAIVDKTGKIEMMNPAGAQMTGNLDESFVIGLDIALVLKLEDNEGKSLPADQNLVIQSILHNQSMKSRDFVLTPKDSIKKIPIDVAVIPTDGPEADRIVTFRDITQEKEDENSQSEFISTASHEMRTPVASIEGYLGLALNPQTATIDDRARKYLESAQASSTHLGRLFQDLLDITKLDDKKIKPRNIPLELTEEVKKICDEYIPKFQEKKINYSFGAKSAGMRALRQEIYCYIDIDFLKEIVSNIIENAIKYSPEGGTISVNVSGESDKGTISVADTGIGIPNEDLQHIFQKFYRVDDRQTREIGGTGLGLYLVKQRAETLGGTVWAESMFGKGSTFFVSLPRIDADEYNKRKIIAQNEMAAEQNAKNQQLQYAMNMLKQSQTPMTPPSAPSTPATTVSPQNPTMPTT